MWKTSVFKLQVNCPGCNTLHPVSSINEGENCHKCGKFINLTEFDNNLFGSADRERYMNGFLNGIIEQIGGSGVGKAGSYKLTYESGFVYCEECFEYIGDDAIMNTLDQKLPVTCPECNHSMPIRSATPYMRGFHSKIVAVVNDPLGYDKNEKDDKESGMRMMVLSCMTCGAGLNLDKNFERNINCNFCGNDNYIPDSIWIKLHPDEDVQPFFVVTNISEEDIAESVNYFQRVTMLKIYEKHFYNFIDSMFQKLVLTESLKVWLIHLLNDDYDDKIGVNLDIKKIRHHFYSQFALGLDSQDHELKELIAGSSKSTPEKIQLLLSEDSSPRVRLALAKNRFTTDKIINILRSDADPVVSSEASNRKTGFFRKLFS
jgi:hypothetical protein